MKIGKVIVMVVAVVVLTALGYGLASWFLGKPAQNAEGATQLEQTLAQLSSETASTDSEYAVGDRLTGSADKGGKKAAVFDPAFPELQWDNLMPADWDPMAAFRGMNIAELQDNDPKAQEALDKMRKAWNDAPVNPAYTGKRCASLGLPSRSSKARRAWMNFCWCRILAPAFTHRRHQPTRSFMSN